MIIHGPQTVPYDIGKLVHLLRLSGDCHVSSPAPSQARLQMLIDSTDKGPIMLTDYFHRDYLSIVEDVVGKDISKVVGAIRGFSAQVQLLHS
jgi:hypothetical protein